jgi:hypothetical protein
MRDMGDTLGLVCLRDGRPEKVQSYMSQETPLREFVLAGGAMLFISSKVQWIQAHWSRPCQVTASFLGAFLPRESRSAVFVPDCREYCIVSTGCSAHVTCDTYQ